MRELDLVVASAWFTSILKSTHSDWLGLDNLLSFWVRIRLISLLAVVLV